MDKRILLEAGGFPVYTRDLIALQDNLLKTIVHVGKAFSGQFDFTGCMLYGEISHEGNTWKVTQGAVSYKGDIFPVEAGTLTVQEGETAYLAVRASYSDNRVYKDGAEHPAEASYIAYLTTSTADAYTYLICNLIKNMPERLRDLVESIAPNYSKVSVSGTDDSTIDESYLKYLDRKRGDDRDVALKGVINIRSLSGPEVATFVRQGLRGLVPGILLNNSDLSMRHVTAVISEDYPTYTQSTISLYEATGEEITSLTGGGAFGFTLYINNNLIITE